MTTKLVKCANPDCTQRRPHYESTEDTREHKMVEVNAGQDESRVFCSITCACMAGYYNVNTGWIK